MSLPDWQQGDGEMDKTDRDGLPYDPEHYRTGCFYEASFISLRLGIFPDFEENSGRLVMVFPLDAAVVQAISEYRAGMGPVDALAFARMIKDVKAAGFRNGGLK
jgi:hypothetical protein